MPYLSNFANIKFHNFVMIAKFNFHVNFLFLPPGISWRFYWFQFLFRNWFELCSCHLSNVPARPTILIFTSNLFLPFTCAEFLVEGTNRMVISRIISEPFHIFHMHIAAMFACIPGTGPVEWSLSIIFFLSKVIICVERTHYHLVPKVLIRELEAFL